MGTMKTTVCKTLEQRDRQLPMTGTQNEWDGEAGSWLMAPVSRVAGS